MKSDLYAYKVKHNMVELTLSRKEMYKKTRDYDYKIKSYNVKIIREKQNETISYNIK